MLTIDYDLMGIRDGERLLDVGCGEGRHSWEACKRNDCLVCALDVDETNLKKAHYAFYLLEQGHELKGKWLLVNGDIARLPFEDESFDKVICSEVLEHIPDDIRGIRELVRVLKGGGTLAVSVPSRLTETICWKLCRAYHDRPGGHIRIYGTGEIISKLQQNDLQIFHKRHKHALHSLYWISRCLFGVDNENAPIPSLYYRFLAWDIFTKHRPIRILDNLLNNLFPKSIVLYARKLQSKV